MQLVDVSEIAVDRHCQIKFSVDVVEGRIKCIEIAGTDLFTDNLNEMVSAFKRFLDFFKRVEGNQKVGRGKCGLTDCNHKVLDRQ